MAKLFSAEKMRIALEQNILIPEADSDVDVLDRIIEGAKISPEMKREYIKYLRET